MTAAAHKLPHIPRDTTQNLADMSASRTDIYAAKSHIPNFHAIYSVGCLDLEESVLFPAIINLDQSDPFLSTIRL